MGDEHTRLSIAVPTFNRCEYLSGLLPSVLQQCAWLHGRGRKVEVIVSDNASPDSTYRYVQSFLKGNSFLVYHRNDSNVGAELNFANCIERANGDYLWILGDDDIIVDGAVERILTVLDDYSPALVVCIDGLKVLSIDRANQYRADSMPIETHESYGAFLDAAMDQGLDLILAHTWIPSIIVRRASYDMATFRHRLGTYYPQMYALGAGLFRGGEVVLYHSPTLGKRDVRAPHPRFDMLKRQNEYLLWLGKTYGNKRIKRLVMQRRIRRLMSMPQRIVRRLWRAKLGCR
jgi:abequosyltransferase